jgi:N-acetylglutamate synthase-like GNAT family acetyltransferase
MSEPIDTGALLTRTYELPAGPRVRLRLARRSDLPALRALLAQRGVEATDLELERLVRYDPMRRAVVCATAPVDGTELLVGVGAISLEDGAEPDTVVVDERLTDGLGELLCRALVGRARARARRVA